MRERNYLMLISHALISIGFFFIYTNYVRTIFEAKTNFNHLTTLSRELLLRKDDALYFSFYKTIVEEPNFVQGYAKLLNSSVIEYPNSLNIVERFHVLPEIIVGYLFHSFKHYSAKLGIPIESCLAVNTKSDGSNLELFCDGVGEPFHFYLEFVWALGGFTVFLLYLYGSFLSENIFGGIYAVVLYFIFHKNAAKIYEKPIARENFAFPFIFWQIFYLALCFERSAKTTNVNLKLRILMISKITILTTVSLLCWQFSSIIFATQILIMITPWSAGTITNWLNVDFAISQLLATFLAYYFSYGNKKFFLSWQNGPAVALLCIGIGRLCKSRTASAHTSNISNNFNNCKESSIKNLTLSILMALSSQGTLIDLLEQSGFSKPDDNPFLIYRDLVLHWSLQRRANFSTSLLACNSDFTEINWDDFWELIKTLFVKPYCLYGVVLLAQFFRKLRSKDPKDHSFEHKERAKNYVLEDFFEENHITMKEMSNKKTELALNSCLKLLKSCNYDYEKYKKEKIIKSSTFNEHENFMNDVKKLKKQIKEKKHANLNKSSKFVEKQENKKYDESCEDIHPSNVKQNENKSSYSLYNNNSNNIKNDANEIGYHYIYSVYQLVMLSIIGLSIKKLFFLFYTQCCVIAPTLCSKFWYKRQTNVFWTISLVVFFTSIVDPGISNIQQEFLPAATPSEDLKSMIEWINLNTEKDDVFGGPIEIIGTIHLTTKRPTVNHAHLEMRQISERTEGIYSIFSRQQSSDIYNKFSQLKIQYIVLSFNDCANSSQYEECDILAIWDEMQPSYRKYPQFCAELAKKNIPSFLKVFANKYYGIIKIFSQSVQLNLKLNKLPEKVM